MRRLFVFVLVTALAVSLSLLAIPGGIVPAGAAVADSVPSALDLSLFNSNSPPPPPAPAGPSIDPSTLTRVRMRLESTSDWATFDLSGVSFGYRRLISVSPGAQVDIGAAGLSLRGPTPAWAEVLGVLDVPGTAAPAAVLRKGWIGSARAVVRRTIGTENTVVSDLSTSAKSSDAKATTGVSRALLVGPGLLVPKIDARPLVLAFYYPWFTEETFQHGRWTDTPSGPANTSEWADVQAMVGQAIGAGVNGFLVSWDGTADITRGYDLVRAVAARREGFLIAPLLELVGDLGSNPARIESLIRQTAAKAADPTSLTINGRPVVYLYGTWHMDPSEWRGIRSRLRASGIDPFVVADILDSRYEADGSYMYNPNGMGADTVHHAYLQRVRESRLRAQVFPSAEQTLWAATVSPGMDDSHFRFLNRTQQSREDGARYDAIWSAALTSRPEWVLITSWNEWYEATHIQPGTRTGSTALDQTRVWSARFTS